MLHYLLNFFGSQRRRRKSTAHSLEVFESRVLLTGTLERATLSSSGGELTDHSYNGDISGDGRLLVFSSRANDVVTGDSGSISDIFLRNLEDGTITRLSQNGSGGGGNRDSLSPSISENGRFVVFHSYAQNLVEDDNTSTSDIYLADLQTGELELISRKFNGNRNASNHSSTAADVSNDGRFVVFQSEGNNLVADDRNGMIDIFLYDRQTAEMTRVSQAVGGGDSNNHSYSPHISGDGRYVVYASAATNLIDGDGNGQMDVFRYDRTTGETVRVNAALSGEANGWAVAPSISNDGRFVAFDSSASNLVAGDTNRAIDVFIVDMNSGTTQRIEGLNGQADSHSWYPRITGDGNVVAFESDATNLSNVSVNNIRQTYVYDRLTQQLQLISALEGVAGDGISRWATPNGDGSVITFTSVSTNLVADDTNGRSDAFVWYRGADNNIPVVTNTSQGLTMGWTATPVYTIAPTDADDDPLTITVTGLPADIVLKLGNTQLTVGQSLTVAQFNSLRVDSPTDGTHGDPLGTLTYSVTDGLASVNGEMSFTLAIPDVDAAYWDAFNGTWVLVNNDGTGVLNETLEVPVGDLFIQYAGQGDVNGDGLEDQLTLSRKGVWMVRLAGTNTVVEWGNWTGGPYQNIRVGDFNGDGLDDVIAQAKSDGNWYVGLSTGSSFGISGFGRWSATAWIDIVVGDFNGDGRDDIAGLIASGAQWWVGLSNGSGFDTSFYGQWEAGAGWRYLRVGDFDGDGNDDVIAQASTGHWCLGYGGESRWIKQAAVRWSTHGWADVLVGDYDGDGADDLVGRQTGGSVWVMQASNRVPVSQFRGFTMAGLNAIVTLGDFNGDGRADLLALSTRTGAWQIDTSGNRLWRTAYGAWTNNGIPYSIMSGMH
ncbi:MAG: VCBS repeat-containing protein [Planctomycetaceae bacterium]|nr:VCBS repeat-containing protein [Planctomycetaceae bacterium]